MAEHKTYQLERIEDILQVPSESRKQCMKELLILLALHELAGTGKFASAISWTDDGDASCAIFDQDGNPVLSLDVKHD